MSEAALPTLIAANLRTHYRLGHGDCGPVLLIGTRYDALAELFTVHKVTSGAFITAFNPDSVIWNARTNMNAHLRLVARG